MKKIIRINKTVEIDISADTLIKQYLEKAIEVVKINYKYD